MLRKPFFILIAAILLITSWSPTVTGAASVQSRVPNAASCVTFEDMTLNDTFSQADQFTSNGFTHLVDPYTTGGGGTIFDGTATVTNGGQAGGSGQEMAVANVNIVYEFHSSPIPTFTIQFGDYGNEVALGINSLLEHRATFSQFDGHTINGVTVSVQGGFGNDTGTISLSGNIESVFIGGQELFIDNACFANDTTTSNCIDFAEIDPGTQIGVGGNIVANGITVQGATFIDSFGTPVNNGTLEIVNTMLAGGTAPELQFAGISAEFQLDNRFQNGFTFNANDLGGSLNLNINGDFRNFDDFQDMHNTLVGGVIVKVLSGGGNNAVTVVELIGTVNTFIVGGQELVVDALCSPESEPTCEPYTLHQLAGVKDNFSLANGTEHASPSSGVNKHWVPRSYRYAKPFDGELQNNQFLADYLFFHSFAGLQGTHPDHILDGGTLEMVVRPDRADALPPGSSDIIMLGYWDSNGITRHYWSAASQDYLPPNSQVGMTYTLSIDLANAFTSAGSAVVRNLLPTIEKYNGLDFGWHDDTSIDFAELTLFYDCPADEIRADLGDAPDSVFNHHNADNTAYPLTGTLGRYPTVFDGTPGGERVGPLHHDINTVWLGNGVSAEEDADSGSDQDTVNNLRLSEADEADLDAYDDAINPDNIILPDCGVISFDYTAAAQNATEPDYHLNVWFDFNFDGDWNDVLQCVDENDQTLTVYEHAVSTSIAFNGDGVHTFTTPAFPAMIERESTFDGYMWMRMTLSDTAPDPHPDNAIPDGAGPVAGYGQGETEDYKVPVPEEGCTTRGGVIEGVVNDSVSGAPLGNVHIIAHEYDGAFWIPANATAITDAAGSYSMTVPANKYRLYLTDPTGGFSAEWHDNSPDVGAAQDVFVDPCFTTTLDHNLDPATPADNPLKVLAGDAEITFNPDTGDYSINIFRPQDAPESDVIFCATLTCTSGAPATNVRLVINGTEYPMTEGSTPDTWEVTIPGHVLQAGATVELLYDCDGDLQSVPFRPIELFDPSGFITDITNGLPVSGATVTLYNVPGWRAATNEVDEQNPNVCQSNLSKVPVDEPWNQPAPTELGTLVAPDLGRYAPATIQQTTGSDGYYGWDVAAGCWYVTVEADGYQTLVSPVVGVPPEVTDLDLQLTPNTPTAVHTSKITAQSTSLLPILLLFTLCGWMSWRLYDSRKQ